MFSDTSKVTSTFTTTVETDVKEAIKKWYQEDVGVQAIKSYGSEEK